MKADKFLKVCKKCGAKCCKLGGANFTKKELKEVLDAGYKDYFFELEMEFMN